MEAEVTASRSPVARVNVGTPQCYSKLFPGALTIKPLTCSPGRARLLTALMFASRTFHSAQAESVNIQLKEDL
ncbi:hypothetical protein J6590_077237 [Homalodisca vitripennis]|nr:hypothetical protein J6590_077237 [Homalodisca vitripennis]